VKSVELCHSFSTASCVRMGCTVQQLRVCSLLLCVDKIVVAKECMTDLFISMTVVIPFQSDKDDSRIIKVSLWWLSQVSGVYLALCVCICMCVCVCAAR